MSILVNSIFANMKNDLQTALSIIYEWSLQTSVKAAARTLNLSPSTISSWYNHIRNVLRGSVRTQSIEGFWSLLKRHLRKHGGTNYKSTLMQHVYNFMYWRNFGDDCFIQFMRYGYIFPIFHGISWVSPNLTWKVVR